MNGYAYANNTPVTASDPDGQMYMFDSGGQAKTVTHKPLPYKKYKFSSPSDTKKTSAKSAAQARAAKAKARALNEIKSAAKVVVRFVLAVTGIDDAVNCFTKGDVAGCVSTAVTVLSQLVGVLAVKIAAKILIDGRRLYRLAVAAKNAIGRISSAVKRYKAAKAAETGEGAASTIARDAATSCLNSFTADTPVTLADGTQEPISKVKVGDKVLATDPITGQTKAEPVVQLIRHSGEHAMVLVTLADGSVLNSTDGHPIWDATTGQFTDASRLRAGDKIETTTGALLAITGVTRYSSDLTAYNLQIDQIHTYYAGTTPVLVHNSCGYVPAGEAANYSTDELAQLTHQHIGAGDIPGRPSLDEIQNVITRGTPKPLSGQNAVQIERGGVRVIINQDNPLRSTAYYTGGH